jgi:hypothetical protein
MGWEKPLYFHPHHGRDDPPASLPRGTFGKPEFFDFIEVQLSFSTFLGQRPLRVGFL